MKFVAVLAVVLTVACSTKPEQAQATPASDAPSDSARLNSSELRRDKLPRVVFLGDSLTAGLGLSVDQSYPSLIAKKLKEHGYQYDVVNAGVSGDTSAGGLRRLDWSLEGDVKVLVVALGGNDALRGLPVAELKKNLQAVIDAAKARHITVILAGMEAPPNNGADYTGEFRNVYSDLARQNNVRLIPFLLQGVAGDPSLNQADGIHPNVRGAELVADLVWKTLEPVLASPKTQAPRPQ